jgi:hypothetical protein
MLRIQTCSGSHCAVMFSCATARQPSHDSPRRACAPRSLLLAAGIGWLLSHRDVLRLEVIEPALCALGIWAPIGFILIYATGTVLFFSGALLGLAGGALFGPVWGTLWNLVGVTSWRHRCVPPGPHRSGRVGGAACWRASAAPSGGCQGRGLALWRAHAPGAACSFQPA